MSFLAYINNNYTFEELQDITQHGCASGCASGLIYYSDTLAMYDKYCDELHDVLAEDIQQFGEMPKYITDALAQGCTSFKNALVWYVAETYASQLISDAEEAEQ